MESIAERRSLSFIFIRDLSEKMFVGECLFMKASLMGEKPVYVVAHEGNDCFASVLTRILETRRARFMYRVSERGFALST